MSRDGESWLGDGLMAGSTGDRSDEEPEETDAVRLRRLLPWLSWW